MVVVCLVNFALIFLLNKASPGLKDIVNAYWHNACPEVGEED